MKTCKICGQTFPLDNFYKGAAKCKPCHKAYARAWAKANPDSVKKSFDETMPEDIGVIAEELEELGLTDFIYYDAEGIPDGVAYEKLALALIPVLKMQQSQIDSVVDRLNKLEK
jgi:hypothetical protein